MKKNVLANFVDVFADVNKSKKNAGKLKTFVFQLFGYFQNVNKFKFPIFKHFREFCMKE